MRPVTSDSGALKEAEAEREKEGGERERETKKAAGGTARWKRWRKTTGESEGVKE